MELNLFGSNDEQYLDYELQVRVTKTVNDYVSLRLTQVNSEAMPVNSVNLFLSHVQIDSIFGALNKYLDDEYANA